MVPFGLRTDPFAMTNFGMVAYDVPEDEFYISAVAVVTFGLIVGNFWAYCDTDATTTWTAVSNETTTWSDC